MKRRHRRMINIVCLGVLLFSLYLNFIKEEKRDNFELPDNEKHSWMNPSKGVRSEMAFKKNNAVK